MTAILARRLAQAAFVVWSIGTVTFVLVRSLPGDMAYRIAAARYGYDYVDAAAAAAVRAELGLDQPALALYLRWLYDLLTLNLGESVVSGQPIVEELSHQLGHSLLLAGAAMGINVLLAFPVGLLAGVRMHSWFDRLSFVGSAFLRAQPVFVIGLCLVLCLALHWRWLPVAGSGRPEHLVLPALSLALGLAATLNRVIRHSTGHAVRSQWFAFARVKGLSFAQAFRRHALRNLSLPVIAFMGVQLVGLIEGIVMVESLFSWPGIGHALAHAVFGRDVPMIQGTALVMGLIFVAINLGVDLCCFWIDPRTAGAERA